MNLEERDGVMCPHPLLSHYLPLAYALLHSSSMLNAPKTSTPIDVPKGSSVDG